MRLKVISVTFVELFFALVALVALVFFLKPATMQNVVFYTQVFFF